MKDSLEYLLDSLPGYLRESAKMTLGIDDEYRDEQLSDETQKIYELVLKKREFLNSIIVDGLNLDRATIVQKNDERIVLTALNSDTRSLEFASSIFQDREDIVFPFLEDDPDIYQFTSPRLKKTKELVLKAVRINGLVLEHVVDKLQDDFDVVFEAVSNNGLALKYAAYNMQCKREIIKKALEENGTAIRYANSNVWMKDKELILIALRTPGARLYIHDIDNSLKEDVDFIMECCRLEPKFFSLASSYVKDVIRVNYIKSYVDALLGTGVMDIDLSSRESIPVECVVEKIDDKALDEFEYNKRQFIFEAKKYYLGDRVDNNVIYEILRNKINYEIDLSISSIVYPITDFKRQLEMFKKGIVATYEFVVEIFCTEYELPHSIFESSINYDILPDDFYNRLFVLKDKFDIKKNRYRNRLLSLKDELMSSGNYSLFSSFIDKEIGEYVFDYSCDFDVDVESEITDFKEFLESIKKLFEAINELWDMFYSIDRGLISSSELKYFKDVLAIETIKKDLDSLGLEDYQLKLQQIKRELSLYSSIDRNNSEMIDIQNLYQLMVNAYEEAIVELSREPGFYNSKYNFFDSISNIFLEFYTRYTKAISDGKCSSEEICDLKAYIYDFKDVINRQRQTGDYAFNTSSFICRSEVRRELSFYKNSNSEESRNSLDTLYYCTLKKYIKRISELKYDDKKCMLKVLNKKMRIALGIYLSCIYGYKSFDEGFDKLSKIDFDNLEDAVVVDDIRVELPIDGEFSGNYCFTVYDLSLDNPEVEMKTSDSEYIYKDTSGKSKKTVSLKSLLEKMSYAGRWDMGTSGIRHIIYKNGKYCLVIQKSIFDDNYIMVLPVSELSDRLMEYSSDIKEEYIYYASKEKFMYDFEKILEDRYLEFTNRKEKPKRLFYYGD